MAAPQQRLWQIFFEVFEPLPRQGPGSRASAKRALDLCTALPPAPAILDLGCGAGGQTFHLAELTSASIVAVDNHAPNIERLVAGARERGLSERIRAMVGDISKPNHPTASFDLIWSEGALYNIGIENALKLYAPLLRPGGYMAFTEAVWRKENPPKAVKASFEEYPAMGWVQDVSVLAEKSDLSAGRPLHLARRRLVGGLLHPHASPYRRTTGEVQRRCRGTRGARRTRP